MGQIFAFMTATVVKLDGTEEYGWIDPRWSRTTLLESRNDAGTVVNERESDEDLPDWVRDALGTHLGAYEDNGDGTFCGTDSFTDPDTGLDWTYSLHFVRKFFNERDGWTERAWHPATDGRIDLSRVA